MDIDIKQQIKELLLKENISMTELVNKLNENNPEDEQTTPSSLNNKLTRGTIKYSDILEIFDVLDYDLVLQKRNKIEYSSSKNEYFTPANITKMGVSTLFAGVGGLVGSALFNTTSKSKYGATTGEKNKNIITGDDALNVAKEFEKENGYNPIMTDEELYEMGHQQERLDLEHDIEVNINAILDSIVLNSDLSIQENFNDLIETYIEIENYPVSFKLTSLYRVIYSFLSLQSDTGLRDFITKLRNLYAHGGLLDLVDEDLENLFEISRYYRDLLKEKENTDLSTIINNSNSENIQMHIFDHKNLLSKPFYDTTEFSEEYLQRFYEEKIIDSDISQFLSELIEFFICDNLIDSSIKELFNDYKKYDNFPTEIKFKKYFKSLHYVSIRFLKDKNITFILLNIKKIYENGGLENYPEEILDNLENNIRYYILHGFSCSEDNKEQKQQA